MDRPTLRIQGYEPVHRLTGMSRRVRPCSLTLGQALFATYFLWLQACSSSRLLGAACVVLSTSQSLGSPEPLTCEPMRGSIIELRPAFDPLSAETKQAKERSCFWAPLANLGRSRQHQQSPLSVEIANPPGSFNDEGDIWRRDVTYLRRENSNTNYDTRTCLRLGR